MPDNNMREVIDSILDQKKDMVISQLNAAKDIINTHLDNIADLNGFHSYDVPEGQTAGGGSASESVDNLHHYVMNISSADNQLNLINTLIEGIHSCCRRAALFLVRDDKFVGWKGTGFGSVEGEMKNDDIKNLFFSISASTIFKKVLKDGEAYEGQPETEPDDHLVYSRFGGSRPSKVLVMPFFVKGKPQAAIYADCSEETSIKRKDIEIIARTGEMSLDLLPIRQKLLSRIKTQEFIEGPSSIPEPVAHPAETQETFDPSSVKKNDPERKARVIINDMILYNQSVVDRGLAANDLVGVMGDTLIQAKEEYLRKFDDLAIFEDQLVKILAKGNKDALKGYKFETM